MVSMRHFCVTVFMCAFLLLPATIQAANLSFRSDTLSTSAPEAKSNHTFEFGIATGINPGGVLTFDFPSDFSIDSFSSTFNYRNIELLVNGVPRSATNTVSASTDGISVTPGAGGSVAYTLNSTTGIPNGSTVTFKIGNHTTNSLGERTVIVGTSSTTTLPADTSAITNSAATGTHEIALSVTGSQASLGGDFIIFLNEQVGVGPVDTSEDIPPVRFNGQPTGTISGTTPNVELSLETDEFATCRYSTTASTSYATMPNTFNSSGLVIHTKIVSVSPETTYTFYVRCIDDEDNANIDDYIITFTVSPVPTGESNTGAEPGGDGSGPNTSGGGGGGGTGTGTGGASSGSGSQSSGSGGGGSGGGGGGGSSTGTGGGFENDGPYESGEGRVYISGTAWPRARVYALVDGQIAEDVQASADGTYTILIDQIARGAYTFGVYAEDAGSARSDTFSTSFTVTGARATTLSNIDIVGTIDVDPDPVDIGGTATIRGYTAANAQVTIEYRPQGGTSRTLLATSGANGSYTTNVATAGLSQGTYEIRMRVEPAGEQPSAFTKWNYFGVGEQADVPNQTDLNRDGRVNLTDFSILLFWWNGTGGDSDPPADINQDGRVSLTDFSILLFAWTG